MQPEKPLLTIAIPTYQRAGMLAALLEHLLPEAAKFSGEIEILVSDNASADRTPDVIAEAEDRYQARNVLFRAHRQEANIGADGNFSWCFRNSAGTFFWICSDDDILVPGAIAEVLALLRETPELDLMYASSFGFEGDYTGQRETDPMGRTVHTYRNARTFAYVVNTMFTFISGIIVNRDRVLEVMQVAPEELIGTNLVQLGWTLPLLNAPRTMIALWTRPVAARVGAAHGYSLGRVFGENLAANARKLLPGRKDLQNAILHPALRRWFPSILIDVRSAGNATLKLDEAHAVLAKTFGRDPRYWLFTWPALAWPLPAAKLWTKGTAVVSKGMYTLHVPGFWRKRS